MVDIPKETDRPVTWRMWLSHHFCKKGETPMTDQKQAPERIYATGDPHNGSWTHEQLPDKWGAAATEYLRKDLHDAAIKRQAGAAKTLREATLAEVQHLKDMDRSEYNAAKSLDSEREANAKLTAEIEALAKQRDELAASEHGLWGRLETCKQDVEKAEAERDTIGLEVGRLTAERDEWKARAENLTEWAADAVPMLEIAEAGRDQALAESAAREIAMRDRAAVAVDNWFDGPSPNGLVRDIRALPLSPDGQQALNEMLADAWESAYYAGRMADNDWDYENPYRKDAT